MIKLIPFLIAIATMTNCAAQPKIIAFPGAEGFGKYATGGRGGQVVYVTNLNDSGEGSLRKAIQKKGPRIIVFNISGYIDLQSPLDINNGDVTIAGQTAPGDGICIRHYPVSVKADNVIIRFLRFRLGDESEQESDALSGNKGVSNVIIDHCSVSWSTDECASFYRNKDFTFQWCIVSESLNKSVHAKGEHGYGGIWGGEGASFHHNLIAHHTSRTPRFSGSKSTPNSPGELVDFTNNVIYNWGSNNVYGGEAGRYNVRNNYYKPGPASDKKQLLNPWEPAGQYFVTGNVFLGEPNITDKNHLGVRPKEKSAEEFLVTEPFAVEEIKIDPAEVAYEKVLRSAGASLSRDAVDSRVVEEVRKNNPTSGPQNNGIINSQQDVGGWPELKGGESRPDSDADGIPDAWEISHGLDSADASDASAKSSGSQYSNIEMYLNSLAESSLQ